MSTTTQVSLFTPIELGNNTLRNRIVMAPMTRNRAGEGNAPTPLNAKYYHQRSTAGLIITEASQVTPMGVGYPGTPGIHSPEQVAGWKSVTDAVHGEGGKIFLQLWHVGRISHPSLLPNGATPVAPSAIRPRGEAFTAVGLKPFETPRELAINEIAEIVEAFGAGARNALAAGFDGVEIHGANGYLIDQFLRDGTNQRTDAYGGAIENRARFLKEVTEAVVDVWGADRVGVRISPAGAFNDMSDADPVHTFTYVANQLASYGLAYLHAVEVLETVSEFPFEQLRRAFGGPYMANGQYTFDRATAAISEGQADLVSFGQPFISNPDLPERFARGAELAEPDQTTFYGGSEKGYTDYPHLDFEA